MDTCLILLYTIVLRSGHNIAYNNDLYCTQIHILPCIMTYKLLSFAIEVIALDTFIEILLNDQSSVQEANLAYAYPYCTINLTKHQDSTYYTFCWIKTSCCWMTSHISSESRSVIRWLEACFLHNLIQLSIQLKMVISTGISLYKQFLRLIIYCLLTD